MEDRLQTFEQVIQYQFNNKELLAQALTHTSYANEKKGNKSTHNERLEFLGDAVLEIIISEYLFFNYSKLSEGELTKFRAKIVCEPALAYMAKKINLGDFLYLGKGEMLSGGKERPSILSDAFEAVIGAVYLDGGLRKAKSVVKKILLENLDEYGIKNLFTDYKTELQEIIQSKSNIPLKYGIIREEGPAHNKTFVAAVSHKDQIIGSGSGKNKKEAEQNAAKDALKSLG
ncbi:ribonuclease III [Vallitalea okinawensis]|uniref:ribonuclease III n=1 Tax=Vallitalea okinawensis TaxID=2078660 RepID=UPI000CFDAB8B|nr:ribonuclease III [Vallitalea okinawensis]